jgi:hypothetical protein
MLLLCGDKISFLILSLTNLFIKRFVFIICACGPNILFIIRRVSSSKKYKLKNLKKIKRNKNKRNKKNIEFEFYYVYNY